MSAGSLRPIIEGRGSGKESTLCEYMTNDQSQQGVCIRTARHKYAYWGGSQPEQFYDLQEDPLERRNLIDDSSYQSEIGRHRLLMIDRLMR
jgi:hypothetical protein